MRNRVNAVQEWLENNVNVPERRDQSSDRGTWKLFIHGSMQMAELTAENQDEYIVCSPVTWLVYATYHLFIGLHSQVTLGFLFSTSIVAEDQVYVGTAVESGGAGAPARRKLLVKKLQTQVKTVSLCDSDLNLKSKV